MLQVYSDDLKWRTVWAFLFQGEDICSISSRLYEWVKTVHRVIDLPYSPQLEPPPNDGTPGPNHNFHSSEGSATQPDNLFWGVA